MQAISRRSFCRAALVSTAAVGMAPAFAAAAPPGEGKRRMTIDLRCGSIGVRADQRRAVELAARHGFESVEAKTADLGRLSAAELERFLADLTERKLVLSAGNLPVALDAGDGRYRDGLAKLAAAAKVLQRAGVTRIGTWIRPFQDDLTYLQQFRRYSRRLREVGSILKDHGLRLGLEYIGTKTLWTRSRHCFVHTMAETKELLAEAGQDNVGFILDSWHWYTARETPDDIRTLKNKDVVAVDLNDAPTGVDIDKQIDNRRELPMATGVIDVAGFLKALVEIGYDGPVRAEPFNRALNEMADDEAAATTAKAMKKAFALIE